MLDTFLDNFGIFDATQQNMKFDIFEFLLYFFPRAEGHILLLWNVNSMKKTMTESMWRLLSYVSACFALS